MLLPLYGDSAIKLTEQLLQLGSERAADIEAAHRAHYRLASEFTAQDVLLLTYGDSFVSGDQRPLAALKSFADANLTHCFSAIHILPFFPFSSDDGFAVCDYGAVREDLGTWGDVYALSEHFQLMFDLVINHCSREHQWFAQFIAGQQPGVDYFVTPRADEDYSQVVRPRSTPLLTPVHTASGLQHVWTTFGEDQIDLNFSNPQVLLQFADILLDYVRRGAGYIRLDAIGFLWKEIGTNCMSLPQTHAVVKVFRLLLTEFAPSTRLLTETNVPHAENVSYFGNGDEAHLVYQFSLAPLLLYTYVFNEPRYLLEWLRHLEPAPEGSTYLNFMASHDGVGLRPLEGLVPPQDVEALVARTHAQGGFVSMRTDQQGVAVPYELNITLFSLFGGDVEAMPAYVGAHQLLLALQGVPALYIHSLFGTLNDLDAVERTGRTRSVNRGRLQSGKLLAALSDPNEHYRLVFGMLKHALRVRRSNSAFDPTSEQRLLDAPSNIISFLRIQETQQILVVASVSAVKTACCWPEDDQYKPQGECLDLLTNQIHSTQEELRLEPYQVLWLVHVTS